MAKHGFRMGGSGKTVVVVPEWSVDADTVSAITVGEAPTIESDAGDVAPTGWVMIEGGVEGTSLADIGTGGTLIVDGVGAVEVVLASEPDVIWTAPLLCAEDDGMGVMQATEVVTGLTDAALDAFVSDCHGTAQAMMGDVDVTATVLDFVASEPVVSPFAALIASYKPIAADCVVRVDLPAMLASDARAMAQRVADMTGVAINVIGPNGVESVAPRRGGGGGGKRVASVVKLIDATAPTVKAERDWIAFDGVAQWGDNPASYAKGYVKLWQAITAAGKRLDLDRLQAYDFAGSREDGTGNSGGKMNGNVLRAWIAKVRSDRAALDAEFGFGDADAKLAAD